MYIYIYIFYGNRDGPMGHDVAAIQVVDRKSVV